MRLKPKYKWSKRQLHFDELARYKKLRKIYGNAFLFGLRPLHSYQPLGLLTIISANKLGLDPHWTSEEIEGIKKRHVYHKYGCFERGSWYDQPREKTESLSIFDDFPLVFRDGKEHFKITLAEDE